MSPTGSRDLLLSNSAPPRGAAPLLSGFEDRTHAENQCRRFRKLRTSNQTATVGKGGGQGGIIQIVQLAPERHAVSDPSDTDVTPDEVIEDVIGRGLAFTVKLSATMTSLTSGRRTRSTRRGCSGRQGLCLRLPTTCRQHMRRLRKEPPRSYGNGHQRPPRRRSPMHPDAGRRRYGKDPEYRDYRRSNTCRPHGCLRQSTGERLEHGLPPLQHE